MTRPLCVDLDGCLVRSDLLVESFLLLVGRRILYLLLVPFWLLSGKARLKAEIARRAVPDPQTLPYHEPFLHWLRSERDGGRELWLCTASNHRIAEAVANHLGLFTGVIASSDEINRAGRRKAAALVERFGDKGFDYCGNGTVDAAVWSRAHEAIVVNAGKPVVRLAQSVATVSRVFDRPTSLLAALFAEMRPHQWAKNLLVLVPMLAAHSAGHGPALLQSLAALVAFSLCASTAYVINDLLDLPSDRQHPTKRRRPLASGRLSPEVGVALGAALLLGSVLVAAFLPPAFWGVLASYFGLTLAYSFRLKRIALIDVVTLAGLYSVRILAGSAATGIDLSFWLLMFSVFLFMSLALVKRYAELDASLRDDRNPAAGRGYRVEDLPVLMALGAASGYVCVLVLALYINSAGVVELYSRPGAIWFSCVLLLYWLSRVWLKTHRGEMHEDPVVFALKDKVSLAVGALVVVSMLVAL